MVTSASADSVDVAAGRVLVDVELVDDGVVVLLERGYGVSGEEL